MNTVIQILYNLMLYYNQILKLILMLDSGGTIVIFWEKCPRQKFGGWLENVKIDKFHFFNGTGL